ncbi:unnamed protein product [Closterium sp. NIES-54]
MSLIRDEPARVVRDHFLSVFPTTLTVDLLEERLLAAEQSIVAVGASRGDPRTTIFEGCSPSPLLPSVASAAAADLGGFEPVRAVEVVVEAVEGVGVVVGVVVEVEVSAAAVEAAAAVAAAVVAEAEEVAEAAEAVVELVAELHRGVAPVVVSASSSSAVVRPPPLSSFASGTLGTAYGTRAVFRGVMDVARTSMIHAAAPHFLWPFAVQYAAHQLNFQPRVSLPETSPTLLWTGKVGDASAFRVWGSRAFVRDLSADKLSPRAVPCVFLGFTPDAPGWQFYHPTSRRVLSSRDVTFDESVPYYRLFPYHTASLPPPPLFLAPGPPPVDPLPPQGPALSGVSQVDAVEPVEVAIDSGAATGAEPVGAGSGGAGSGGAETGGAEPGGAESGGAEPWGAESGGTEPGGTKPGGTEPGGTEPGGVGSARVASRGASSRREVLSPQELREWFARRWGRAAGAGGTTAATGSGGTCPDGAGATGPGGTAEATGVGPTRGSAGASGGTDAASSAGTAAAGAAGVGATGGVGAGSSADAGSSEGTGAGAPGAGGATGAGAPAGSPGTVPTGSGGAPRPRPYFVPLLEQVLGLPPSPGPAPPLECPQPVLSQSLLQPVSPLPAPSPYTGPTGGLAERPHVQYPLSTRHSLSALPSDESVEPSGPYPELVGCLMFSYLYPTFY